MMSELGRRASFIDRGLHELQEAPELSRHLLLVLASLEKFQKEVQDCKSREEALAKMLQFMEGWDVFHSTAFYLVDETMEFQLYLPSDPAMKHELDVFMQRQIQAGKFAWALQQNREILVEVPAGLPGKQAVLHGMSTRNTTLGVFVGFLKHGSSNLRSSFLKVLSIMIDAVVYVVENHNLLEELTLYNQRLEKVVDARTQELRFANENLNQSNAELKKLNEKKSEFLGIAAHDLKNPLSGIIGLSELIKDHLPPDDNQKTGNLESAQEMLHYIHESATQMVDTLNELMNSEIIESGHMQLDRVDLDLGDLVQKVVSINHAQAHGKRIRIHVETESGVIAYADALRMHEAVDNLVSNAIKYSPPDREVWVRLKGSPEADGKLLKAVFSVTDQGPGLTEEDKQKLFGRFQKLSARPTGGESSTGLGLSIVKNLIELHDGTVWVESEAGKGATFAFQIPLTRGR